MKVTLLNYTHNALETLLFTKMTRLKMSPGGLDEIMRWPVEKKLEQLEYMRNTIQSSWEFIDYIFIIEDVTRAFTHQLVRHRHNSYAQQAQRAVDMSGFEVVTPLTIQDSDEKLAVWTDAIEAIDWAYQKLRELGVPAQDARGLLPTNIHTNIVMKANLRSLHDMMSKRLCVKAQGEAQDVFREIRKAVLAIHPWAEKFLRVHCATYGNCLFPTYPTANCPAKGWVYNPETGTAYNGARAEAPDTIQGIWEEERAEAQPDVPQGV